MITLAIDNNMSLLQNEEKNLRVRKSIQLNIP